MSNSTGTVADVNWVYEDYFEHLLKKDGEEFGYALELMVDDLHKKKDKTVNRFMCHQKVDALLFGLLRLLSNENLRVAGNTAYILGCLAESQLGCYRLLSTVTSNKNFRVLPALVKMLTVSDGETVMNAAGTIGTLAESKEGRDWILGEDCFHDLVDFCSGLLASENLWTGSNAALVLARLSISDQGCSRLASHGGGDGDSSSAAGLLGRLCRALGSDDAGRGMNAAFALGRLVDTAPGAELLARQGGVDLARLVRDLADMTGGSGGGSGQDQGAAKNACFCLSCLAGSEFGHGLVLGEPELAARLLDGLVRLLAGQDEETAWFAALAIRIISSKPKGAKFLKSQQQAVASLKSVASNPEVSPDLKEEVASALEFLRPLDKPFPPIAEVRGCHEIGVRWLAAEPARCRFPVTYELQCGQRLVYSGGDTEFTLAQLQPATAYSLRLRLCTEADKSPFSEAIVAATEEAAPSKPTNLRLLAATATQLKVGWDASASGSVRTYLVFCDGRQVDCTTELTSIISGLAPCSQYSVQVCASSSKGKSERAAFQATTLDLGAHAPPKPQVTVLGRHEMTVSWESPEQPLGRINHYNVMLNGRRVVYSGTDMSCKISPLTADTEYLVTVVVVTNEGKAESKPAKKRTAKDEFDPQRQPLWCPSRRYSQASLPLPGASGEAAAARGSAADGAERRRGSLAKIEPRPSKPPQKTENPPPARRRSLPPPVELKVLKETRETRQVSSVAPTTLVLDRFGDGGGGGVGEGGRPRRVTSEEVRASVHISGDDVGGRPPAGWSPLQPVPPPPAEFNAEEAAAAVAAAAAPQLSAAASLALSQTPARSNARPELQPLLAIGSVKEPPPASQQPQHQQQESQQQRRRQHPRNSKNRRSNESVWLQSRSLVSKQAKADAAAAAAASESSSNSYRAPPDQDGAAGAPLANLNARSSTDRFKANLAILNSKSLGSASPQQQQLSTSAGRLDWNREATTANAASDLQPAGKLNRHGTTLVRLDRLNRERSLAMPTRSVDFPLKRQPQQLN